MIDLHSFVGQYFPLGKKSPSGFYILKCPICHDTKPRAGFKFTLEGFGYNCFRGSCHHKFRWEPGNPPGKAMYDLFATVGVSEFDIDSSLSDFHSVAAKPEEGPEDRTVIKNPVEINLPDGSVPLRDSNPDDHRTRAAIRFLLDKGLDPLGYPYYLCNKPPVSGHADFRNRIIIPYTRRGKTIFYQGRWYWDSLTKIKYLNVPGVSRDQIFFNMDELYRHTKSPLILVEGAFDAIPLLGYAIAYSSNVLTKDQIYMLNKCPREKILIPDYDLAGKKTVEQVIEQDWDLDRWSISFPDWGYCNDLGQAAKRFGPVRVAGMIHDGIADSQIEARVQSEIFCIDK